MTLVRGYRCVRGGSPEHQRVAGLSSVSSGPEPRVVELRCPVGPRKLFAKVRLAGRVPLVTEDNLIELACQNCRRDLQRSGQRVAVVLHRYAIDGSLVETEVVPVAG